MPDVLYDLEINPNRPDAMSVAGVARDLAARLGVPFALPEPDVADGGGGAGGLDPSVEIVDPDLCGRFVARVLDGVPVGPSPRVDGQPPDRRSACGRSTTSSTSPTT